MKKYTIYIISLLLLFAISCKKDDLPQSQSGAPEFKSEFSFNGEQYNLIVGENGIAHSSTIDTLGTGIDFMGVTGDVACTECGPSFELTLQSPFDFSLEEGMDMVAELNTWNYKINRDSVDYVLEMKGLLIGGVLDGDWFLNGVPIEPIGDSLLIEISNPGNYSVRYSLNLDSCNVSTTRNFTYDGGSVPCYGNIIRDTNSLTTFYAYPGFPYVPEEMTYIWTAGNTSVSTGNVDNYEFPPASFQGEICVEMTNAQGCNTTACYTPDNTPDGMQCTADMLLHDAQMTTVISGDLLANLILNFTDNSGQTYTSVGGGDQSSASVTVISIDYYSEPSMPARKFAKMEFAVDCLLYDEAGNQYPFSGNLQTAFEYP